MSDSKKQLILNKGMQKFIYRYENGNEDELLNVLVEQAKDNKIDFDWFDAAVLSFRLTQELLGQADTILCRDSNSKH